MKKVITRSVSIDFVFYMAIACFGYISTKGSTVEMITDRDSYIPYRVDFFMDIGRFFLYIAVLIHIPINYHPLRRSAFNLIFSSEQKIEGIRYTIKKETHS